MQEAEYLFSVAQIAVTLAGFSALFLVLSSGTGVRGAPRTPNDLGRKTRTGMLQLNLIVVLFALLPFLPDYAGLAPELSWRILSGAYVLVWLVYLLSQTPRTGSQGIDAQMATIPMVNQINVYVVHPLGMLALLIGAAGGWGRYTSLAYLSGLLIMLFLAGVLFLQNITALDKRE